MENNQGDRLAQLRQIKEEHAGKILDDQEVIKLVMTGDPKELDTSVQWLGSGISVSERPISRFADILARNFHTLPKDQREAFLINGLKFAIGDFKKSGIFQRKVGDLATHEVVTVKQKNVGELLNQILKFTDNDLQSAKDFLRKISLGDRKDRQTASLISYNFYRPQPISPLMPEETAQMYKEWAADSQRVKKEYLAKNPKIRLLAFWLDAYLGNLNNPKPNLDNLLENDYPESDIELKTQVMTYVKENLLERKISDMKYYMIEKVLASNDQENMETPDSPLAKKLMEESNLVRIIMQLNQSIEQTKNGTITAEKLAKLLEEHPFLLKRVKDEELQMAIDKVRDHGLATRLIKLRHAKDNERDSTS